ncbi:membrane anchor subunit of succinate dehydrogenase, Sdh4 [Mortierella alpina]|nr:membrane anchor subunit of succinate dehydrogenase, Sdh4 [Mortierella alpina]
MALRLAASPLAASRSTPALRRAVCVRSSASINVGRVYSHASRNAAAGVGQTPPDVTDVYKATPYKTQTPNQAHGSHHWNFERLLSVSMIPLFAVSAFSGSHPVTDGLLGVVVPIHAHMGFDAMITDYLHPGKVGVLGNKAISWTLRGATLLVLVGCYQFNAVDIGLTEVVKKSWTA